VNSNVVVMWSIPPLNTSPSFEVSAVFPIGEIGDVFPYAKGPVLIFYCLWSDVCR